MGRARRSRPELNREASMTPDPSTRSAQTDGVSAWTDDATLGVKLKNCLNRQNYLVTH